MPKVKKVVDSLIANNIDAPMNNNPTDKIPLLSPTPQVSAIELKKDAHAKIDSLQTWTLRKIGSTGALALVAYPENWDEILTQLQEI